MSGAQTSTFGDPNILYKALSGMGTAEVQYKQNELLQQQQDIGDHEIEMGARLAGTLLSAYDTPEARAAAYPTLLAQARQVAPGYFKNAPAVYPGDEPTKALARLGTPSADLIKLQGTAGAVDAYGNSIGVTGTAGGGGGGAGRAAPATGGTDTAPINAAGDSRTRKAGEGGPPAAGSPGAAVAKQVHDFWIGKGFSEEQVAGIMAGGPGSESDFTPTAGGDKVNGVATSYGLYQHHGVRLANMQQFFGLSPGQMPSADQQNQYAHWEITQGPLKNVGDMLKQAKTPAEAATIWTQYFGVPADKSEIGRRAAGAQRFVGLYGQPQQGGPGSPQAPPGVTMGQVGDQTVPPPPGGAPGAYPAYGGGMGTVIGRPAAVSGTPIPAGRPTGPPVITDRPAGSNVVAGPPGAATVGAPQPPSPEVPGNVAAINAGISGAGGQPVTDPNLTPTPARYAGTTPAPSVEAPPEAGWGSQVGSGYGPQNALAPPAPAQPAVPPAQQPPVPAQQPPASAPAAQAMPPELVTDNSYLTDRDKQQLAPLFDQARRGLIPLTTLQNEVQQRQTFNVQRQKDFLAAQQQQMENARQVAADQRAAETQRLAQITSKREQDAAAALAEQRRVENQRQQESAARDAQRLALEQKKAEQGSSQEDRDYYNLRTEDPSSQKYADSYVNRKWTVAPNGNVIENDMSRYPAPNRSIQRPSFVPAPTPQGLDEVRKADTDAKVITSAIDHYTDVFSATGGGGWDAYFANPKDPKTQQLLGAFDRMKTVLRSPVYYNTGVLQPAEINLMSQDLVSPQSLRGVFSTPQALATRLSEIKLAVLTRQDAELRSIGRDGVIVRDKADFAKIPAGGRYYDESGNLRVKPEN